MKFLLNGISWNQTEIQLPGASEEEEVYLNLFLDHARQGHSNLLPLSEKHIQVIKKFCILISISPQLQGT